MPYQVLDTGQKLVAARLHERGRDSVAEIAEVALMSRSSVYRSVRLYEETGSVVVPKSHLQGRPRALSRLDIDYLVSLVRLRPSTYLGELQNFLAENRGTEVTFQTIHNELLRREMTHKKLHRTASESNSILRAEYCLHMGQYYSPQLVFLDETSKDDRTFSRVYGRAPITERAVEPNPFIRGTRYSLLPAMSVDGIIAADVVEGSYNRDQFTRFLEEDLLPICSPYPGPRSVLVMDNCRIHHSPEIDELIDSYGCRLEFLPPYSPDLNPIEYAFSAIKAYLQEHRTRLAAYENQYYALHESYSMVNADMAQNLIEHCGYW